MKLFFVILIFQACTAMAQISPETMANLSFFFIKNASITSSESQGMAASKELFLRNTKLPKASKSLDNLLNDYFQNISLETSYYKLPNVSVLNSYHSNRNTKATTWQSILENSNTAKSCTEVCPDSLSILNLASNKKVPIGKNWLSFINSKTEYRDIPGVPDPTYNYCIGHSAITMTLRHLAYFDPENTLKTFDEKDDLKKELVKRLRKLVHTNTPVIFPYVKNIHDLSVMLNTEIKQGLAWSWFSYGVSWANLQSAMNNTQTFDKSTTQVLIQKLTKRLLAGVTPVIIFNPWKEEIGHTAQVIAVKTTKDAQGEINRYVLVLDDSNNQPSLEADYFVEKSAITLTKNDDGMFEVFDHFQQHKIGRINLLEGSDDFYARIVPKLAAFCKELTHCN